MNDGRDGNLEPRSPRIATYPITFTCNINAARRFTYNKATPAAIRAEANHSMPFVCLYTRVSSGIGQERFGP